MQVWYWELYLLKCYVLMMPTLAHYLILRIVGDAFIAAKSPANLLITPINSSWPYIYGPYSMSQRYGQAKEICDNENLRADGIWGTAANLVAANTIWNPQEKMPFPKLAMYFEYTDKVNGIGYRHAVIVPYNQ